MSDNSAMGINANAPLGNLMMQDSEGINADVEVDDDDFDYEDVQIQGAEGSPLKQPRSGDDSDFL